MFSNKFDVGIVYVFKVEIIRITFKFLLIRSNICFFKFLIPICFHFFFVYIFIEFPHFFSIFFPRTIVKLRKFKTKKKMLVGGGGGVNTTTSTQNFTKLNCIFFTKKNVKNIFTSFLKKCCEIF